MKIYLDTCLWNQLYKHSHIAEDFLSELEAEQKSLVLGDENLYEFLKFSLNNHDKDGNSASRLFKYLKRFIMRRIPIVKTNMELLASEMWAIKNHTTTIDPFINHDDYSKIKAMIENACSGHITERERNHIAWRIEQASNNRQGQIRHLINEKATNTYLQNISPNQLSDWLDNEEHGQVAQNHLTWEIQNYFKEASNKDALQYAIALMDNHHFRVSRDLIRRTLYYNWRCANRGSIPNDLYFDTNHIINSSYCDIYATEESRQEDYANLLLNRATKVIIYDRKNSPPITDWILSLE